MAHDAVDNLVVLFDPNKNDTFFGVELRIVKHLHGLESLSTPLKNAFVLVCHGINLF